MAKNKSIAVKRPASARNDVPAGNFSRKHSSSAAMEEATLRRNLIRGPLARRSRAKLRTNATRTPEQQLDELDYRLGSGVGAKKERARLWRQIDADRRSQQEMGERARVDRVNFRNRPVIPAWGSPTTPLTCHWGD